MLLCYSLIQLLRGDLAGVISRHVRVDVPQNNRFGITAVFLEKQEYISQTNGATISYIQEKFRKDKKLFWFRIISRVVAVEFVRAFIPFNCL